jgi:hypothetical protein
LIAREEKGKWKGDLLNVVSRSKFFFSRVSETQEREKENWGRLSDSQLRAFTEKMKTKPHFCSMIRKMTRQVQSSIWDCARLF